MVHANAVNCFKANGYATFAVIIDFNFCCVREERDITLVLGY